MGERILNPESSSGRIAEGISGVSSAMLKLDLGLRVSTFSSNGLLVIHPQSLTRVVDLRVSHRNSDRGCFSPHQPTRFPHSHDLRRKSDLARAEILKEDRGEDATGKVVILA